MHHPRWCRVTTSSWSRAGSTRDPVRQGGWGCRGPRAITYLAFSAAGAWLATVDAASWLLLVLLVLLMVRRWCGAGEGYLPTAADRLRFSTQSFDARPRQAVKIVLISLSSALIARGIYRDTASRGLNAALLAVLILSLLFNCLDVYSAWSRSIPLVFLVGLAARTMMVLCCDLMLTRC